MNKFAKTLLAAALFAGAGAANASIDVFGTTDSDRELFMQVYDSIQKVTYSLDVGVTLGDIYANRANPGYEITRDLSGDANWLAFTSVGNFNPSATQYVLAVGRNRLFATQQVGNPLPAYGTTQGIPTAAAKVTNHAQEINVGWADDVTQNLSKLVADTDSNPGKWATQLGALPKDLWGASSSNSRAAIDFGQKADFWGAISGGVAIKLPGQWLLSGNTLEYKDFPVSNVPLPAAVWMFGAGVMGLLGATRRKSQAV